MAFAIAKHSFTALLFLAAIVVASPAAHQRHARTLSKRGALLTAQYASEPDPSGLFMLQNNLWGESAASNGSQVSQLLGITGKSAAWMTTYTWAGNTHSVKSYANLDLQVGLGKPLASIASIPTSWNWSYVSTSSDLVADVSYDLWLANAAGSMGATLDTTFEIMIWLSARGGASPAGSQVATAKVHGMHWKVYKGTVSTWTVFSFVAPQEITNFKANLLPFFTYLISKQGVPSSQVLVQLQAGTEPFCGSATLATSSFSATIN